MYNDLKTYWNSQYRLSANKVFADFLYYLERGGEGAIKFINANPDLVETVAGGPDEVSAIIKAIENDPEAAENKAYFFGVAAKMLSRVRSLLQRKFDVSVRYCEQIGIEIGDLNAETIIPGVRRSGDGGDANPNPDSTGDDSGKDDEIHAADGTSKSAAADNDQPVETASEEQPTPDDQPSNESAEADEKEDDAKSPENLAENDGDADGEQVSEQIAPITEDDLKAKINMLAADGTSKSEIWQAVTEIAEPLGWGAKRVWAYVDEITPKQ